MTRLGRFAKPLGLLIAAQAVCLALGLWIHDRFVLSCARWGAEKKAWEQLCQEQPDVQRAILRNDEQGAANPPDHALLSGKEDVGLLLVDASTWKSISSLPPAGRRWEADQKIAWQLTDDKPDSEVAQGWIQTPWGRGAAVAWPQGDQGTIAVLYRYGDALQPTSATFASWMPTASAMSFVWILAVQGIVAYMVLSRVHVEHASKQSKSDEETLRRTQDLVRTRDAVIFGLAKLTESRNPDTGHHLERISLYSTRLATALRRYAKYRDTVNPAFVRLIGISSALHDIGKVGVRDSVLLKKSKLTGDERRQIETHTVIGGDCLKKIEKRLGTSNFLEMAREIALCHHERWDGSGYPRGLEGEAIPLAARIVAIADVYDALSTRRPYKEPIPHEQCVEYIRDRAGRQFDADLVEVFLKIEGQFAQIARRYAAKGRPATHEEPAEPQAEADLEQEVLEAATEVAQMLKQKHKEPSDQVEESADVC